MRSLSAEICRPAGQRGFRPPSGVPYGGLKTDSQSNAAKLESVRDRPAAVPGNDAEMSPSAKVKTVAAGAE